jgi:hypothetical protein
MSFLDKIRKEVKREVNRATHPRRDAKRTLKKIGMYSQVRKMDKILKRVFGANTSVE